MNLRLLLPAIASAAITLWSASVTTFNVASIKRVKARPDGLLRGGQTKVLPGGRWSATNISVKGLIQQAYGVNDSQVIREPDWTEIQQYNVEARADTPDRLSPDQARMLLQALLADRFQLRIHRETRDIAGYSLVVGKNGPKLKPGTAESDVSMRLGANGMAAVTNMSMARLAKLLASQVNAVVVNNTGLEGDFDFSFKFDWTAADREPLAPGDPSPPSAVFQGIEQIGLRLVAQKVPGEVIVIDKVAKASEN